MHLVVVRQFCDNSLSFYIIPVQQFQKCFISVCVGMLYNRDFRWISRNKQTSKNTSRERCDVKYKNCCCSEKWSSVEKIFESFWRNKSTDDLTYGTYMSYIHDSVFIQFNYMSQIGPRLIKERQRRRSCTKVSW